MPSERSVRLRPRYGASAAQRNAESLRRSLRFSLPRLSLAEQVRPALCPGRRRHRRPFADPDVAGILTVIGGFNSNQLLPHLDWDLIAANPKIFCGYSDITAVQNAILARTGLITYSGPHWSSFGMRDHFEQTLSWFAQALFGDRSIELYPAAAWTDDLWFLDQDNRTVRSGEGWWPLAPGQASGRIVGGNLCTLNLLQGTEYMPALDGALLMIGGQASLTVGPTSSLRITDA